MSTVHISIGNTDGKLTHAEWAGFGAAAHQLIVCSAERVYGVWHSMPASPYVNACWAVEIDPAVEALLKDDLARLARKYRQDSIAWLSGETEFITPEGTK